MAIETGSMERGLGRVEKYVFKDSMIYIGFNWHEKWKSTLNAYLNKTLQRERRQCFLKQWSFLMF